MRTRKFSLKNEQNQDAGSVEVESIDFDSWSSNLPQGWTYEEILPSVDDLRKEQYRLRTDHLFQEAVREKLEGRDQRWNEYIAEINKIKTEHPKN